MSEKAEKLVYVSASDSDQFAVKKLDEAENTELINSAIAIQQVLRDAGTHRYVERGVLGARELAKLYHPSNIDTFSKLAEDIHYPNNYWVAYALHEDESVKGLEVGYDKDKPVAYAKLNAVLQVNEFSIETSEGSLSGSYKKLGAALLMLVLADAKKDAIVSTKVDLIDLDGQVWYQELGFVIDQDHHQDKQIGTKPIETVRLLHNSVQNTLEELHSLYEDVSITKKRVDKVS